MRHLSHPYGVRDRLSHGIILIIFVGLPFASKAFANPTLSLALGAIEEGDERFRPEWIGRCLFNSSVSSELHYYGRIQGPVRQMTLMLTTTYNYPILGSKWLLARIGAAATRDETVIHSSDPERPTRSRDAYNLGAYFGLGLHGGDKFTYSLDWNNGQFLAGSAGIFLATARRQSISLGVGWAL